MCITGPHYQMENKSFEFLLHEVLLFASMSISLHSIFDIKTNGSKTFFWTILVSYSFANSLCWSELLDIQWGSKVRDHFWSAVLVDRCSVIDHKGIERVLGVGLVVIGCQPAQIFLQARVSGVGSQEKERYQAGGRLQHSKQPTAP